MRANFAFAAATVVLVLLAAQLPTAVVAAGAKKKGGQGKSGRKHKSKKAAAGSRAPSPPRRSGSGQAAASSCPPGYVIGRDGVYAGLCVPCPRYTYSPQTNADYSCTVCPPGTITFYSGSSCCVGADSQQQCTASPGGICLPWEIQLDTGPGPGPSNCTYPVPPAPVPSGAAGIRTAVACDGANLDLSCPAGALVSGVVSMFYGRFDATTCAPGPNLDSMVCVAGSYSGLLDLLNTQCRGQASCSVPSSSWYPTFGGDPCFNTLKALRVQYSCGTFGRTTVCDAGTLSLSCQSSGGNFGVSAIADYNGGSAGSLYGRASKTTCYGPGYANIYCRASDAALQTGLANLWSTCRGQPSCTLGPAAWSSVMKDPCRYTVKYFDTSYLCAPVTRRAVACDGAAITASCADVGGSVVFTMMNGWGDKSSYGQAGGGYCPGPISNTNCAATDNDVAQALNQMQRACVGQQSCTVPWDVFSDWTIPDPCFGTVKYFVALYACV